MTMETTQIFILIVESLLAIIIAVGGFIVNGMSERIKSLEVDMNGMKLNYLDRFKEVIANQTEAKENLTRSQSTVKEELIAQQTKVKEELLQYHRDTKEELTAAINQLSIAVTLLSKPKRKS